MDYSCPYCGSSLKKTRPKSAPLPGQRKFLPLKTGMACRSCSGLVTLNFHPVERHMNIAWAVCVLLLLAGWAATGNGPLAALTGILILGAIDVFLGLWTHRRLKSWQRYARAESEHS